MKLCINCKHFEAIHFYKEGVGSNISVPGTDICTKTVEKVSPITGSVLYREAIEARKPLPAWATLGIDAEVRAQIIAKYCGPDARLFEEK